MDRGEIRAARLLALHADQRRWPPRCPGNFLTPSALRQARDGPTVYVHGVFETVTILLSEAARVVHRRAESFAIRLLARTPSVLTRVFTLSGAAQRLHLDRAADAIEEAEHVAEEAVETAVGEVAATAGPLVLFRTAKALANRRRSLPVAAIVVGAVGVAALALRRAAHPRRG
jgi:hypothetical protein